jgi:uncharacterized membrane protein YkvI
MDQSKKNQIQWTVALGAAAAWFGQHCGSGFASGLQMVKYFTDAGYWSLFTTLFPLTVLGFVFYYMGEYAREIKAASYKEVALTLYSDNKIIGKAMLFFFDLIIMGSVLISTSTVLAGAATLMEQAFGMNYLLASILFTIVVVVISMFGAKVLAQISLPLVIILVIMLLAISGLLINENWRDLMALIKAKETFGVAPRTALGNMLYYTGLQTGFIGAYMAIAGQFTSKNDNKVMAISGAVVNTLMLAIVSLAVLSRMPYIAAEKIPILTMVAERFGTDSVLNLMYTFSLFLAYISTADVVAATSRFGIFFNRQQKRNQVVVDAILGTILVTVSLLIAQFGIVALVDSGYKFLSLLRGPVYIAGGLIFAPWRLWQIQKKRKQELASAVAQ